MRCALALLLLLTCGSVCAQQESSDPKLTEIWEPEPRVIDPGGSGQPPSDAIVLFDGSDLAEWQHENGSGPRWSVVDGAFTVVAGTGNLATKRSFGSIQLHIEWRTPPFAKGEGQGRGNSGVFLMKRYEVQVLDSFQNRTYSNGQAGSVYKQFIPKVNASRGPGVWQSYDIVFAAPSFTANGSAERPAMLTVLHNGILIQNHVPLTGPTVYIGEPAYRAHPPKQPLMLQDHGTSVSFRNIWVRELSP